MFPKSRSSSTKTAYLCVYIRMNGKVILFACLSFLPALQSRCNRRRFCPGIFLDGSHWCLRLSKNIPLGDMSVAQLYIYFPFFCLSTRKTISSVSWLRSHAWLTYAKNIVPPLFDDFPYSAVFTLRFTALVKRHKRNSRYFINLRKKKREREREREKKRKRESQEFHFTRVTIILRMK